MRSSLGSRTLSSVFLSVLLALGSAPAQGATWDRFEVFGFYAGNQFAGIRVADYGLYSARYGLGLGTRLMDARLETWDLPRKGGRPDATADGLVIPVPLEARAALLSWEGGIFTDSTYAESSIGRLELHGWYCPWAMFGITHEYQTSLLGHRERVQTNDTNRAEAWEYGLRLDSGHLWYVSVGRFEFRTKENGAFRARSGGRWYGAASIYFGRTHGKTFGGSPLNLLRDARFRVCRLLGGCGVIEG